jgi:hypothetical protein
MKQICAGLLVLALVSHAAPSWAEDSTLEQAGYGAGSVLGTLVYAPFKASFCILGGIGAAFTAIASPPTAGKVARASCGGTWIITPSAVKGDEPVHVVGDARSAQAVSTSAVASN